MGFEKKLMMDEEDKCMHTWSGWFDCTVGFVVLHYSPPLTSSNHWHRAQCGDDSGRVQTRRQPTKKTKKPKKDWKPTPSPFSFLVSTSLDLHIKALMRGGRAASGRGERDLSLGLVCPCICLSPFSCVCFWAGTIVWILNAHPAPNVFPVFLFTRQNGEHFLNQNHHYLIRPSPLPHPSPRRTTLFFYLFCFSLRTLPFFLLSMLHKTTVQSFFPPVLAFLLSVFVHTRGSQL